LKKVTIIKEYDDKSVLLKETKIEESGEPEIIRQYVPYSPGADSTGRPCPKWPFQITC